MARVGSIMVVHDGLVVLSLLLCLICIHMRLIPTNPSQSSHGQCLRLTVHSTCEVHHFVIRCMPYL